MIQRKAKQRINLFLALALAILFASSLGTVFGAMRSFIVGPSVKTLPATPINQGSAILNGTVNPNGADSMAWFEWGFTTNYGNITHPQALGAGNGETNFSQVLADLIPNVRYHFRAVASNNTRIVFGENQSFPQFAQRDYVKAHNSSSSRQTFPTVELPRRLSRP